MSGSEVVRPTVPDALPGGPVLLLVVDRPEDEARAMDEAERWTARTGAPAAPVLDRDGLPDRLAEALRHAGRAVDVRRAGPPAGPQGAPRPGPAGTTPAVVLRSEGVEPGLAALASRLCRAPALPLGDAARARAGPDNPTALVLLDVERTAVRDASAALSALSAAEIDAGIVYAAHPTEARFALLKSLLVPSIDGPGDFTIVSHQGRGRGGPPALVDPEGGPEVLTRAVDVMVLSGHSTPIDSKLGPELILCGRAGAAGTANGSAGNRSYPCFASGDCFRQRQLGRDVRGSAGLVSITAAGGRLLVLCGCNTAAPGGSWFDARSGLAYQSHQGKALAVAVTASMVAPRLELDALFMALLAQGLPLGRVVRAVNAFRTGEARHASALGPGVGPFLLFGNPCLRVTGLHLHEARAVPEGDGRLGVDLQAVPFHPERGALVRVRGVPEGAGPSFQLLPAEGDRERRFCAGVGLPGAQGRSIYCWLSGEPGAPARLSIDASGADPGAPVRASIEQVLAQVPFWLVFLAGYVRQCRETGHSPQVFERALAQLAPAASDLAEAVNAARPRRGSLVSAARMRDLQLAAFGALGDLVEALHAAPVEVAGLYGTVQSHGWDTRLERLEPEGPLGPCCCGGGDVWGQRYRFPDGGRLERVEYQCAACGPIGEDDGRGRVRLRSVPRRVPAGRALSCAWSARAPQDAFLHVRATAVLETWMKDERMASEPAELILEPGEARELSLEVAVPRHLPAGTYPFALLAVANGALVIGRQMVEVGPAGA